MATSYNTRLSVAPEEGMKAPVVVATSANITLSGTQTISGTAVIAGDRVCVRAQTTTTENGIYTVATGAWTRSTDFNQAEDVVNGQLVVVNAGSEIYKVAVTGTWTPGSTAVAFNSFSFASDDIWDLFAEAPTQTAATTFTVTGDQTVSGTGVFTVGARLKLEDVTDLYGTVTAAAYTTLTTVTVTTDSGSLTGSLTAVHTSRNTTTGSPVPGKGVSLNLNTSDSLNLVLHDWFENNVFSVLNWVDKSNLGDGTDISTNINNALTDIAVKGGVLLLGVGLHRIETAAAVTAQGVSIKGLGADVSILDCLSCNGINFTSPTYDNGCAFFEDFAIQGASGSDPNYAAVQTILPSGGVSGTDSRDGLHFSRLKIYDWNQGFIISNTWESSIKDCHFEKVNNPASFGAYSLLWRFRDNFMVYNGGDSHGGTAAQTGVLLNGTGVEGVYVEGNLIYAFQTCIDLVTALHVNIFSNDVYTEDVGFQIQTANTGCNIKENYIVVASNNGKGIHGVGLGSQIQNLVTCESNLIRTQSGSLTGTVGLQLNESGTQNNYNWRILNNHFIGFSDYEILVYNGNKTVIDGNKGESTGVTNGIKVTEISGGRVLVGDNDMEVAGDGGTQTGTYNGTFTPEFADASSGGTAAGGATTAVGYYSKQGAIVVVDIDMASIDTTGLTSGSHAWLRGLPFTIRSGTTPTASILGDSITSVEVPFIQLETTAGRFWANNSGGAKTGPLLVSAFADDAAGFNLTIQYLTDE